MGYYLIFSVKKIKLYLMSKQFRAEPQWSGALQTQYVFARVFINKKTLMS